MGLRPMAGDTDDPECLAGLRAPEQMPDARCGSNPRRLDLLMGIAQPHLQPLPVHHPQAGA
jgi:hypothetical protein